MDKAAGKLTVLFDEPFWVGIFEYISDGRLNVCKVTFGAEPKDYEICDFIMKHYDELQFSPAVEAVVKEAPKNPKRIQRDARKQTNAIGIGTKSQQALKLQQEQMKLSKKQTRKEKQEAQKQYKFDLKQQKRKEKHRGR